MFLNRFLLPPLRYVWEQPFPSTQPPQPAFENIKDKPLADFRFVIFFTPRSGSSYLTELIKSTKALGDAVEVFNPPIAKRVAQAMGSRSLEDYCDSLLRARNTKGVFSAEIIWTHLDFMFRDSDQFLDILKPDAYVWLRREDFIAQAVSIMSMIQTNVAHTAHASPEAVEAARAAIAYDPREIKSAARRIIWMEKKTEAFFARHKLRPLRLSYETMIPSDPNDILRSITQHIERNVAIPQRLNGKHKKLAGSKSTDFANRFRAENTGFVRRMENIRASFTVV